MIILIFAVIGIGLTIWLCIKEDISIGGTIGFSLAAGSIGALFGLIFAMGAGAVPGPAEVVNTTTTYLYALQDNQGLTGYSFLGSGYVKDELKYYYAYKTADGGYKTDDIKAKYCTLYYVEDETECRIEHLTYRFINPIHNFLSAGINDYDGYNVYIPEGSIVNNYCIDLK